MFFANGKPQFIAKNDKEGCLMLVSQASKLALQEIRQKFSTIVRERKKETGSSSVMSATKDSPTDNKKKSNDEQPQESSIYYKDTAIFRFVDEAVKVVRDTEFINEFRRRANDAFWEHVDCIQTCIKAKTGIGVPIFVHFLAPINENEPTKPIVYNFLDEPGNEDLVFAYKQCMKIAYYVSKVYN